MTRTEVIQKILDKKGANKYLEIGVEFGTNFFPIRVKHKIAVDPNFKISKKIKTKWTLKRPFITRAKYCELSSDNYFASSKNVNQLDLVFIDGLHSYKQSLKDVENSLQNLKDDGIIVMHDCNPPNEAAAFAADSYEHAISLNLPGWTNEWCGDVWKTICYLRSNRNDLKIFVLDSDYGLGIITKEEANATLDLSNSEIENMTYNEFYKNKNHLLNLTDESFFSEFLKTV